MAPSRCRMVRSRAIAAAAVLAMIGSPVGVAHADDAVSRCRSGVHQHAGRNAMCSTRRNRHDHVAHRRLRDRSVLLGFPVPAAHLQFPIRDERGRLCHAGVGPARKRQLDPPGIELPDVGDRRCAEHPRARPDTTPPKRPSLAANCLGGQRCRRGRVGSGGQCLPRRGRRAAQRVLPQYRSANRRGATHFPCGCLRSEVRPARSRSRAG